MRPLAVVVVDVNAKNVLEVLSSFSKNVKPRKDSIDLSKTYTTEFVDAAAKQG